MSSQVCIVCANLLPKFQVDVGVKFTSLRKIYDSAAQGCEYCQLLRTSFEAVLDAEAAERALSESEKWSSNDARVLCEYLEDGDYAVEFFFECPSWRLRIDFWGIEGEPNPMQFITEAPVRTHHASTWAAKRWIANCIENHAACGLGLPSRLPKRILNISQPDLIFLVEPSEETRGQYACQSYCWGDSHTVITDASTYENHKAGISVTSLPKTFRETIAFARSLNLQYLWIDAMCIIQDSIEDWRAEAAKMAQYYSNAYITLAATMSASAEGGLFQPNDDIVLKNKTQTWLVRACRHLGIADAANATLFGRGWIFQERLLSPRVIHFTTTELCFECNHHSTCECGQDMPDQGWQVKQEYLNGPKWQVYKPTLGDTWHRMVEAYCKLQLTRGSDKLLALSGLADQMRSRRDGATYLAGLWSDTFLSDLVWNCRTTGRKLSPKPSQWRAPSWSWVSATDPVRYLGYPRLNIPYAKVIDVHCKYIPPSTTGEVEAGHLVIGGPSLEAVLRPTIGLYALRDQRVTMNGNFSPDYLLEGEAIDVVILRIAKESQARGSQYGLVLRQLDDATYERIGLYDAPAAVGAWTEDPWDWAENKTFKIV
ncbi:heterokaryon incompatibility protein-domain-containing protein [Lophiotrema nucula]|uniref:Heterokaryon incompatibility protein-domain-containing protein n=1 Tax=Lophiotrema nucula TaxID=690887 RepID=A0A6A5ZK28_9PLEO|nr:heterokaryon incompatibility protein-domain-containing protein [Lophiotrema nucula]